MRRAVDLARFDVWARMIEHSRFSNADKAALKFKAWAHYVSEKNFFGILLDIGRIV